MSKRTNDFTSELARDHRHMFPGIIIVWLNTNLLFSCPKRKKMNINKIKAIRK